MGMTFVIKYLRISRIIDISLIHLIQTWKKYIFNSIITVIQESENIEFPESLGIVYSIQYIVHTLHIHQGKIQVHGGSGQFHPHPPKNPQNRALENKKEPLKIP